MDAIASPAFSGSVSPKGAAVVLTGVEKHYDSVGAVRGVSLDIASGEFITLLGPSGSGKTTTLMMIAGFETPSGGDISIDRRSVVALPPHKRNIGMVFQNYALFPHLTVAENIGFPLKQRGVDKATRARQVGESLELVRLPGYQRRYPRQLSGGQQQRVALARAIVFHPRLLLMDEPLGALDKQLRESLQLEIRRLHSDLGMTFVYVTHDQEEALTMSDRIAVMHEGRIEQIGTPEVLYDRPANRFVASFIGETNFLPAVVRGIEDGVVVADCAGRTLRALIGASSAAGDHVALAVRPERIRFASPETGESRRNQMPATVIETVFAGERCRYLCRCDGGLTVVVKEPSSAMTRRHGEGERVDLEWSVGDAVVV
jgi:spermidine/putrescine ABC transporter ATP-binding subunit